MVSYCAQPFSPAHPLARLDVPLTLARAFRNHALHEHRRPFSPLSHSPESSVQPS